MGKWLRGAQLVRKNMDIWKQTITHLQKRLDLPVWAELDSGASVRVGDSVRWGNREYVCILSHTKANARHPRNAEYWQQVED